MSEADTDEAAERQEWMAYVPEISMAIQAGYLDLHISQLITDLMERRTEIGVTVKVRRPKSTSVQTAARNYNNSHGGLGNSFAAIPAPYATRQDVVDGRFDPSKYPGNAMVQQAGDYYRKSDINDAGLKFIQNNTTFELLGANKFRGCHFELVSIKRTRAVVVVMSMDMYLAKVKVGNQITIPLDWLVRSMRAVQFPVSKI